MDKQQEKLIVKELMQLPGVGKSVAYDFMQVGIRKISDLKGKDGAQLYADLNRVSGFTQNKCFLYVFKCAVYYAETPEQLRDREKCNWWYWKNN